MEIDNSRAAAWRLCPWYYYENYERDGIGVELKPTPGEGYSSLELGSRVHEILEEYYKHRNNIPFEHYPEPDNKQLTAEANWILSAYNQHYPNDNWEILDVERTFKVVLPDVCCLCYSSNTEWISKNNIEYAPQFVYCKECGCNFIAGRNVLIGKIDLFIRDKDDGKLYIIDHKTEKRGAKSNVPQKWSARDQASLYLWAAQRIYKEPVSNFIVNVLTRPSEKQQVGPTFPERQKLERSPVQLELAIRDIVWVADQIESMRKQFGENPWPASREQCYGWGTCAYYWPHLEGWSAELKAIKYQPKAEYLHLDGVEVVR